MRDGHNVQAWADLSAYGFDSSVIAVTIYWYNTFTGEIVEFDVANNTQYSWAVHELGGSDPDAVGSVAGFEDVDVENIGAHEAGHALAALNDMQKPGCGQATMYAYSGEGEVKKRSLEQADIDAVKKVYANGDDPVGGGPTGVEYHSSLIESVAPKKGPWYALTATITIRSPGEDVAPEGATVTGRIFRDGATSNVSGTVDNNGQAQLKLKTQLTNTTNPQGDYTVIVDSVDDGSGSTLDTARECRSRTAMIDSSTGAVLQGACSPGTFDH